MGVGISVGMNRSCLAMRLRQPALALGAALTMAAPAWGAEPPSVVIIFDGSGSMWGNFEGAKLSKLVLAREAVRHALERIDPHTRVGIAAFGHRRGDCADVEVMRSPEPLNAARILEPLDRLNPKGRGPLTLALREAAKVLPPGPAKRSLVLIHDDADNCQQDLCAVAAELHASGIVVNEVGLALKAEDVAKMACLPRLTNGRFIAATSANEVGSGIEQALLATSDLSESVAGATFTAPFSANAALPDNAAPGLYPRAVLAEGGAPLSTPLDWIVSAAGDPNHILFAARAANPAVPAAAGRYRVEAHEGAVAAGTDVEVRGSAATPVALVLNAGLLRVSARLGKAGVPLEDAIITITAADATQTGSAARSAAGTLIAAFKGSEALALLPAGRFLVRVEDGLVHAERSVVVPAGSQGHLEVALDAARLQVSTSGRDGGSGLDAPVFSVDEDDPDAPKGRREIARSALRQADFVVPPGTYNVVARQDGIEVRERLALAPGELARRTLAVAAGQLGLAIKAPGLEARGVPVAYRIEHSDGVPGDAIATSRPAPQLLLAPGRYRVEARYGTANARSVKEIEVKAGQTQQLTLEPAAAAIKMRLAARAGGEVFWEIREEGGKTVWTTAQPEPTVVLQAGRYRIRAELRDRRIERPVELRAGESRLLELAD
jgi:Ca-activated chloride channel family protein